MPVVLAHDISHAQIGNAMHVANVGVAMLVALSSLARLHTASPDQCLPLANPDDGCIADVKPDGVTWDPELEAWTVAMPEFRASFKASKYASQSHAENAANHYYTTMKTTMDQVARMTRKDLMTRLQHWVIHDCQGATSQNWANFIWLPSVSLCSRLSQIATHSVMTQ